MPSYTTYALEVPLTATLDSSGAAQLTAGPIIYSERWRVRRYTCMAPNGVVVALYRNSVNNGSQFDYTLKGNNDVGSLEQELQTGEVIVVTWMNGQPGTTATVTLLGDRIVLGNRAGYR